MSDEFRKIAAREIDGGRQFFTRAYDFGFTRSVDETLSRWPREVLLEDAVRVIRRFKPQVVVSVFPPTAQAGHGQHQAAGVIAPEAFRAAGYPWAGSSDPAEDRFHPWVDGAPGLPGEVHELLRQRGRALRVTDPDTASDLRERLQDRGVVVRDRGARHGQQWRPLAERIPDAPARWATPRP